MATASKSAATRVYKVTGPDKSIRLVRCSSPAGALRHVVEGQFAVSVADSTDFEIAIKTGTQVEHLKGQEQLELPTLTDKVQAGGAV